MNLEVRTCRLTPLPRQPCRLAPRQEGRGGFTQRSGSSSIISHQSSQLWMEHNNILLIMKSSHSLNAHGRLFTNHRENTKCCSQGEGHGYGSRALVQVGTVSISLMWHKSCLSDTYLGDWSCNWTKGWRSESCCWWGCSQCRCRRCWHAEGQEWDTGGGSCWRDSAGGCLLPRSSCKSHGPLSPPCRPTWDCSSHLPGWSSIP